MKSLFEPDSIAVIGASATEGKSGYIVLKNLIDKGYRGRVYPINPNAVDILGYRAYPTILDVPDRVDLGFLLVPGQFVKETLIQCGRKGVKTAVIVSAGFAEVGEEGMKAQRELEDVIKKWGIRCIGPNTVGLINVERNLFGSFVSFSDWQDGPVAIGAQSGIFAGALAIELMEIKTQQFGICKSLSFGNMIDLDETDFLEYVWQDPACRIIAFYLERIKRPRAFLSLANKVRREKPIIVLKSGRTEYGAKASLSHTGSMALNDSLVDTAFRQYGIVRTDTLQEFLGVLKAFVFQPLPRGNRIGVITFTGASGVMASDEMFPLGLALADLKEPTVKRIKEIVPAWQPVRNPVDLWPAIGVGENRKVYEEPIHAILEDENVDVLLCILIGVPNSDVGDIGDIFARAMKAHPQKPIFLIIIGGRMKKRWIDELEGLNLPIYSDTSLALKAIRAMHWYLTIRGLDIPDPG